MSTVILYFTLSSFNHTVTAPFNNIQTLKFKAQPRNVFSATVNQMFGGGSHIPTTAKCVVSQIIEFRQQKSARQ